VIVARLEACAAAGCDGTSAEPLLVARYHNKDKAHHAERVMMEDSTLLRAIRALTAVNGAEEVGDGGEKCLLRATAARTGGGETPSSGKRHIGILSVFISMQPCHHSSSTRQISCTSDLQRWYASELLPHGIQLDLAIAYPYRTHWQVDNMSHEELLELGARSLWGPRFHSKGSSCSDVMVCLRRRRCTASLYPMVYARASHTLPLNCAGRRQSRG